MPTIPTSVLDSRYDQYMESDKILSCPEVWPGVYQSTQNSAHIEKGINPLRKERGEERKGAEAAQLSKQVPIAQVLHT